MTKIRPRDELDEDEVGKLLSAEAKVEQARKEAQNYAVACGGKQHELPRTLKRYRTLQRAHEEANDALIDLRIELGLRGPLTEEEIAEREKRFS